MSDVTFNVHVNTAKMEQLARPGAVEAMAAPVVKKWAFVIEGAAKQNAPVLTGFLKGSIQAAEGESKANWTISDGAEYGIYQELGTRFIPPKFFLTRACESNADKFYDDLVRALR